LFRVIAASLAVVAALIQVPNAQQQQWVVIGLRASNAGGDVVNWMPAALNNSLEAIS
jgi:hypothetical protein